MNGSRFHKSRYARYTDVRGVRYPGAWPLDHGKREAQAGL